MLSSALASGDALLLGVDLVKDAREIIAGYADQKGLRRQLALRAIRIMNEQLGANFEEENFQSRRVWNPETSSVEMSLVATQEAKVFFEKLKLEVFFSEGEGFQTGFSTKFSREGITGDLAGVGLKVTAWYSDTSERFAVLLAVQTTGQTK
ncbi:Histidine N-alpha-methyltransferase [Geodia barretti]|uniref:Histidine N-alpha-methyltransferase n=1 Tax=Geodia barretti TaxID=519541 RepID=A0AA35R395_GEOBA|nr:Histidine N-alpha-methyltransferase [Geodia barretti]